MEEKDRERIKAKLEMATSGIPDDATALGLFNIDTPEDKFKAAMAVDAYFANTIGVNTLSADEMNDIKLIYEDLGSCVGSLAELDQMGEENGYDAPAIPDDPDSSNIQDTMEYISSDFNDDIFLVEDYYDWAIIRNRTSAESEKLMDEFIDFWQGACEASDQDFYDTICAPQGLSVEDFQSMLDTLRSQNVIIGFDNVNPKNNGGNDEDPDDGEGFAL